MPKPIEGYVEPLRRPRHAASRAVERIRSGELGSEEVDFSDLAVRAGRAGVDRAAFVGGCFV